MKVDAFKKLFDTNIDVTCPFKVNLQLEGLYAKYYQFLKEICCTDEFQSKLLDKYIVETGLINVMKDIWVILLGTLATQSPESKSHKD